MKKISEITQHQFDRLRNVKNKARLFKKIVNLPPKARYGVGGTTIIVKDSKPLDVFKQTFNSRNYYYIIVEVIDKELAVAYSLYPI